MQITDLLRAIRHIVDTRVCSARPIRASVTELRVVRVVLVLLDPGPRVRHVDLGRASHRAPGRLNSNHHV